MLDKLSNKGISVRVASPKLVMEEAPESYKGPSINFSKMEPLKLNYGFFFVKRSA